jgi:hypothetical protein
MQDDVLPYLPGKINGKYFGYYLADAILKKIEISKK